MKPLEALRENHNYMCSLCNKDCSLGCKFGNNFIAIVSTLNRSEELEKTNLVLTNQLDHERKIRIRQEKKLKALEIIKEKPVLTPCIFIYETYKEYIKECGEWNEVKKDTCYTNEEFDLLKDVLL